MKSSEYLRSSFFAPAASASLSGLPVTPTSSKGWNQVALGAPGESPSCSICAAMYSCASRSPRVAGPRPSRRSEARKRTCDRSRAGLIALAAFFSAGEKERGAAASTRQSRVVIPPPLA